MNSALAELTEGRFTDYRSNQEGAVTWLAQNWADKNKCLTLSAPVGSGKSLVAVAAAKLAHYRTLYLVSSRQLERQLKDDFPDAVLIEGRSHYNCPRFANENLTAEDCTHHQSPCPVENECPYKRAKAKALHSQLVVTNIKYFLYEANYVKRFSKWADLIILDEADLLERELCNHVSLVITQRQLDRLNVSPPRFKTKFESWKEWAQPTLREIKQKADELEEVVTSYTDNEEEPPSYILRELLRHRALQSKLEHFINWVNDSWVWELGEDRWTFKPVWVEGFGKLIFDHSERYLAMSATLLSPDRWAKDLGIEEVKSLELPSTFPVENRKIEYFPACDMSMNKREEGLPALVRVIDIVLDKHPEERGIIHCTSYKVQRYILANSKRKNRLLGHSLDDRTEKLSQLLGTNQPLVLVSPSYFRGVSLDYDYARFQIITTIFFPDMSDKQVSKRYFSGGKLWYLLEAARDTIQASGRATRAADDTSRTYVLDERFPGFIKRLKRYLPDWFLEEIEF